MREGGRYVVGKDGKTERVEGTQPAAARTPGASRQDEAARKPARKAAPTAPAATTDKEE